jgi:hypothetical protein
MVELLAGQAGILILFVAGISYIAVGIYLLQTAARENGGPSFFLGWALLCNGFSFGLSEISYVTGVESSVEMFLILSRGCSAACSVFIAMFAWRVFNSDSRWAGPAVAFDAAVIAAGLAISIYVGDWEGYSPLANNGFWLEWVGCTAPFAWLSIASFRQYRQARLRIPLGLIDPVLCNRYFLIGLYSLLATVTYFIYIPMYIVYELHGVWSGWLDVALALVEVVSVSALALSFSAPPFYRKWIGASAAETSRS